MDWLEVLKNVLEVVLVTVITTAAGYLTIWLKAKKDELLKKTQNETARKYIDLLDNTIMDCVLATNQTYVEALKKDGLFNAEAQKEAFNRTFAAVKAVITEDAQVYLNEAVKDLDVYITNKIEADIKMSK